MPDPHALVRLVDELLWALRRDGFEISTAQAIDVVYALQVVGFDRVADVREAVACLVVRRARDRPRYDAAFDRFFSPATAASRGTLWERLRARGFGEDDLGPLRELLAAHGGPGIASLVALLDRGASLDRLIERTGLASTIDAHSEPKLGFLAHRLVAAIGAGDARRALADLRSRLVDALGARGEALGVALALELEIAEEDARAHIRRTFDARAAELAHDRLERRAGTAAFASLSDAEMAEVRLAVRRFAERLRGGARVRARRARRGRVDPHRTLRHAMRTGGVPCEFVRRRRLRKRPKVVLLCDVSDSVRAAALFLLEFMYAAQELFESARSFVFVSDLGETTQLFAREPVHIAIDRAWRGQDAANAGDNSNYGRVLRKFEARYLGAIDRATTVIILGDGRTNYHEAAPEVLDRIRERSRALIWLCPEARGEWAHGDSAMGLYAPKCSAVYEVRCARDLERAAGALVSRS
jgi:uncharacterized protein with von Willebrand factor type A (vWA) domain